MLRGVWGHAHTKTLQRCCCRDLKLSSRFLPVSHCCLSVMCYIQWAEKHGMTTLWHSQSVTVTLPKPSQVCIYDNSRSSHSRCCGSAGWLVLCAVTLSPCTSVELISLSLQLMITSSMRQYIILHSTVSSLASFHSFGAPCALWYTEHPFMCATTTYCYLSYSILITLSVSMCYALAREL